jgi:two-component system, OmpR family, sensor histidine kinase BaeS
MRTNQRLFLAVIPAVIGVLTVAGLAYWGQYAHTAPHIVVLIAAIAAIGSLVVAWFNARYVAQRIAQLAAKVEMNPGLDELDAIETVVDRYASALKDAESRRAKAQQAADLRIREHGDLLTKVSSTVEKGLDEIRLPLHILLENRFGDLNENQEEMLETARTAAENATADVRRLAEIAELDRGALTLRSDRIHLADVLQALRPTIESEAVRGGVRVETEAAPALSPVSGDRGRLQEALALILTDCVRHTPAGGVVRVTLEARGPGLSIVVTHGAPPPVDVASALAQRLLEAHGAAVERAPGRVSISLPVARVVGTE